MRPKISRVLDNRVEETTTIGALKKWNGVHQTPPEWNASSLHPSGGSSQIWGPSCCGLRPSWRDGHNSGTLALPTSSNIL